MENNGIEMIRAGANVIIPDYRELPALEALLFDA